MEQFLNKIHLSDCIKIMRQLPDKSIDLILTDPPYGQGNKFTSQFGLAKIKNQRGTFSWNNAVPAKRYFNEIFRVSKNQIIFGGNYFKNLPTTNAWIVWDKVGELNIKNPFSDCELVWTSFKHSIRKFTCIQQGFIKSDKSTKIIHPTQKPLSLFIEILELYTKKGDTVLDPYCGSGTTAVACHILGRNFIGIEREKPYHKDSCIRLEEVKRQQLLSI